MIKKILNLCKKYIFWFILLAVYNVMFAIFLWLVDADGFTRLLCGIILGSLGLYCISIFVVYKAENRKEKAMTEFLENPDFIHEEEAAKLVTGREKSQLHVIGNLLRERDQKIKEQNLNIQEYEEYIEIWAHEIKTPLALMTFILDNREDEISPAVYHRLEYTRSQMQEDIDRILYYARLKSAHVDYMFERISLLECCQDVLNEYGILLQERKFRILNDVQDLYVISDKKGLVFLISQVISNSIKYAKIEDANPFLNLFTDINRESGDCILGIRDKGIGVKPYDLPFLFQKGFTGDIGEQRKRATGMGLYLVKQIADALTIKIEVMEEYKEGFEIHFQFPNINIPEKERGR